MEKYMEHPRQIIRKTMVEMLTTGETLAGKRIFDSRDFTLSTNATPAIIIRSMSERLDAEEQQDFGLRRRIMQLAVECYHTGDNGAQFIDKMAWQVENIIHANPTLHNKVESCLLMDTVMDFADDGSMALYVALMNFDVTYCTHLQNIENAAPLEVLVGFAPEIGKKYQDKYVGSNETLGGDDAKS